MTSVHVRNDVLLKNLCCSAILLKLNSDILLKSRCLERSTGVESEYLSHYW